MDNGYRPAKSARASWADISVFMGGSRRKPQANNVATPVAISAGR